MREIAQNKGRDKEKIMTKVRGAIEGIGGVEGQEEGWAEEE